MLTRFRQMNHSPTPVQRGPKTAETVVKNRYEDEQEREQAEQRPVDESDQGYRQRKTDTLVDQKKRIFCIPNPPVLQRSPVMKASRARNKSLRQQIHA